jgi:DNA-binding Lrp family transcriptional regulator
MKDENNSLDKMDLQILTLLQKDGRMSYRKIAEKLNTTTMTVGRRVSRMKSMGAIKKFTVVVDPETVGKRYGICLFIQLDNPTAIKDVSSLLSGQEDLYYIHHVTGEFEIAAMARCQNKEEASKLIEQIGSLKGVVKVVPHSVLETIKEDLDVKLT